MLDGRIAVVTGASAGIGRAVAHDLAAAGARVVINARREDRLAELANQLGNDKAAIAAGDCADDHVITHMLDEPQQRWGRDADLVVVNAGRGLAGSVFDSDESQWEQMLRTNVLAAAKLMRAAARRMVENAPDAQDSAWVDRPRDIIVLGSNVGKHISPFSSMYGSTKFAVNSLAEALRREMGPKGVRVTLVAPGIVRTEFQSVAGYDPDAFTEFMDKVGPVLTPEDVARLVVFVASQPGNVHINDITIRPTRQDYP